MNRTKDLQCGWHLPSQRDKVMNQITGDFQHTKQSYSHESIVTNKTNTFHESNATLMTSNDSGFSSKSSLAQDKLNKNSEFEHCGDTYVSIKMNSRKEMILEVTSLKTNVTLSNKSKIPRIMIELTSKPSARKFHRKTEVEVLRAVDGMICLNASFKSPIDSILDVNSLILTFFKTTKHSFCELGFVEIPSSKILPNINNGTDTLLEGWFDIYKFVDSNNNNKSKEENKENESLNNREMRKRKSINNEPIYESIPFENKANNNLIYDDNVIEYEIQRNEKSSFGFTILPHSKPAKIRKVNQDGTAFDAGIRVGDEIISVNGSNVIDLDADIVCTRVKETRPHHKLKLVVRRQVSKDSSSEFSFDQSADYPSCLYLNDRSKATSSHYSSVRSIDEIRMQRSIAPISQNTTFTLPVNEDRLQECFRSENKQQQQQQHQQQPREHCPEETQATKRRRVKVWKLKSFLHSRHSNNPGDTYEYIDMDALRTEPLKWNPDISQINSEYQENIPFPQLRCRLFESFSTSTCYDLNEAKLYNSGSVPEGLNDTIVYENPEFCRNDLTTTYSDDNSYNISSINDSNVINTAFNGTITSSFLQENEKKSFHSVVARVETEFLKSCDHCKKYYINPLRNNVLSIKDMSKLFQNYEELVEASRHNLDIINSIETVDEKIEFLCEMSHLIDTRYRPYVEGCDEAFKFLEGLFDRDNFRTFLEMYDDNDHVKPITSCLLLPLLHVINIAKSVYMLYGDCDALDSVTELAEKCSEVIERVSEYWDKVVEKTINESQTFN